MVPINKNFREVKWIQEQGDKNQESFCTKKAGIFRPRLVNNKSVPLFR